MDFFDSFTPAEMFLLEECIKNEISRLRMSLSNLEGSNSINAGKIEEAFLSRIEKLNIILQKIQ